MITFAVERHAVSWCSLAVVWIVDCEITMYITERLHDSGVLTYLVSAPDLLFVVKLSLLIEASFPVVAIAILDADRLPRLVLLLL